MGLITRGIKSVTNPGSTAFSGGTPDAGEVNVDHNIMYNEFNGNLETVNFASSAFDLTGTKVTGILPTEHGGLGTTTGVRCILGVANEGGAGTLTYSSVFHDHNGSTATEANVAFPMPFAGTLKNLYVRTLTVQGSTAGTLTVRKNGSDTSLVATITAGGAIGTYSDTTNTVSFSAGDRLTLAQSSALGGNFSSYSLEYVPA